MKVKVISLPYIFQVLYVLCFTRPRYQMSVYRTTGPLLLFFFCFMVNGTVTNFSVMLGRSPRLLGITSTFLGVEFNDDTNQPVQLPNMIRIINLRSACSYMQVPRLDIAYFNALF